MACFKDPLRVSTEEELCIFFPRNVNHSKWTKASDKSYRMIIRMTRIVWTDGKQVLRGSGDSSYQSIKTDIE